MFLSHEHIVDFISVLSYCVCMKKIITSSVEETHALAKKFISKNNVHIITLDGDLGSGKTTFTQGVLAASFAEGPYTSPTFTIMKEYEVSAFGFEKIYHIDAYRISGKDMVELGWNDIVDDRHALVIIEWPENIANILPKNATQIQCKWISESEREYAFL